MSHFKKVLLSIGLLSVSLPLFAQAPENLALAKKAVAQYYNSGEYFHDLQAAVSPAKLYLASKIATNTQHKKLAIVLDIDETSVSHYKDIKKNDFGQPMHYVFHTILTDTQGDPIKPIRALYHYAQAHQVATFFVTGRKEYLRQNTIKLLHNCGYDHWTKLYLEPNKYHNASATPYKSNIRKQLVAAGYDIVVNAGDQYSDLRGGYADENVKLPNPFYIVS